MDETISTSKDDRLGNPTTRYCFNDEVTYEAACLLWPPQTRSSLYLTYAVHEEGRLLGPQNPFAGCNSLCAGCDGSFLACLVLQDLPAVRPTRLISLAGYYRKAEAYSREAALLVSR